MIAITDICKDFGRRAAVQDVSSTCAPSTIPGHLGPNGAGKSTILKMLLGLRPHRAVWLTLVVSTT